MFSYPVDEHFRWDSLPVEFIQNVKTPSHVDVEGQNAVLFAAEIAYEDWKLHVYHVHNIQTIFTKLLHAKFN